MVFTTHPLLVIPLNIKQLNIFPVPSLLWLANLQQSILPLPTDMDMATDMDSTTPSLLPPLLPQRRPLRLRLIPLSSTPDTTVTPTPTDTVLVDTMADMVDTPAVDTTVMDSVDSVMPTMVKQTNKQTNQKNF